MLRNRKAKRRYSAQIHTTHTHTKMLTACWYMVGEQFQFPLLWSCCTTIRQVTWVTPCWQFPSVLPVLKYNMKIFPRLQTRSIQSSGCSDWSWPSLHKRYPIVVATRLLSQHKRCHVTAAPSTHRCCVRTRQHTDSLPLSLLPRGAQRWMKEWLTMLRVLPKIHKQGGPAGPKVSTCS